MKMLNDPNDAYDQQRRLMIFMVLIFGAMFAFTKFGQQPEPNRAADAYDGSGETVDEGDDTDTAEADDEDEADSDPSNLNVNEDGVARAVPLPDELPPQQLLGLNSTLSFSNVGGRLSNAVFIQPEQYIPHEDVQGVFPNDEDDPLSLSLGIEGLSELDSDSMYAFVESESVPELDGYTTLVYRWTSFDGDIEVTRTYETLDTSYGTRMTVNVRNNGTGDRVFDGLTLGIEGEFADAGGGMFNRAGSVVEAICVGENDMEAKPARRMKRTYEVTDSVLFGAVQERYFMTAIAASTEDGGSRTASYCSFNTIDDSGVLAEITEGDFVVRPGDDGLSFSYTLYVGPKAEEFLSQYEHNFGEAVRFGFLKFLATPIRWVLLRCQALVINWGLAIILLTLLIKLIMLPLTQKSYENMEKMRAIQPELKVIQKKYENDRMKLAEKQMELFKEHGTSPAGGCLPMFLQMPIWFALYRTIWNSAELYNAPFILWIQDLSVRDPYFILPALMTVTMVIQQKMMPQAVDNPQMKIMQRVMPIMFAAMMAFLPSGLVLYIFVNMALSIAQQFYIRRRSANKAAA